MVPLLVGAEHFVTNACGKYQAQHRGYKNQEAVGRLLQVFLFVPFQWPSLLKPGTINEQEIQAEWQNPSITLEANYS